MPHSVNPLDTILPIIGQAVEEWKQRNTPELIKAQVMKLLDKNAEEITMKLLGFDVRYGESWKLDHCNGRSGNSAAGDYIRQVQAEAIKEWLAKVELPVLSPTAIKKLEKEILNEYTSHIGRKTREKTIVAAQEALDSVVKNVIASNNLGSYMQMLSIINPQPNQQEKP